MTRVSVLSLLGLPNYDAKRRFRDQLASTRFSWIKKNPAEPSGLGGLLIIDEVKDFNHGFFRSPGDRLSEGGRNLWSGFNDPSLDSPDLENQYSFGIEHFHATLVPVISEAQSRVELLPQR